MLRPVLLAAAIGGLTLVPLLASAQAKPAAPAGGMVMACHAPKSGEKANTQMMTDKSEWMCQPVDTKKVMSGPDMTNIKSMDDLNKAWKQLLQTQMGVYVGNG